MADLILESFEYYGTGSSARIRMLEGFYGEIEVDGGGDVVVEEPPGGARTGSKALAIKSDGNSLSENFIRRVLPAAENEVFMGLGIFLSELPVNDNRIIPVEFRNSSNSRLVVLTVSSTGALVLKADSRNGTVLAQTSGPVLVTGTWEYIELRLVRDSMAGIIEIRVNNTEVLNATNLDTGSSSIAQYAHASAVVAPRFWIDDVIIRDTTGTTNNTFMGDLSIATLPMIGDGAAQGWTPRPRANLGTGILDLRAQNDSGISTADAADLEINSGDYTLEGFVRFDTLPSGSNKAEIASKWRENDNQRSWRLFKAGPDLLAGNVVFQTSTDGQAGTVETVHSIAFPFEEDIWYFFAVSRIAGVNRLFIGEADGQAAQQGTDKADSRTYFDGTAVVAWGAEVDGSPVANTSIDGFMDELRFTNGTGRYSGQFSVPTAKFPRDGTDPSWNDVVLLAGFDNGIEDESQVGRTVSGFDGAAFLTPDDADFAFQTVDDFIPRDDTFIEAALIAATGVLTLSANPADTETVSIEEPTDSSTRVYTFVASLSAANDVLIGADAGETLENLQAAVNGEAGEGTIYGTGTTPHADVTGARIENETQFRATAKAPGVGGNNIDVSDTLANGAWDAATLTGGQDIPGVSEFFIGRLDPEITGVRSVSIINRSFKTDAGASEVTLSFVGSGGAATAGTAKPLTIGPTYRQDIFEVDPDTSGALTPATLTGALVRIDRTL